jgi:hypothetical protein
MKGLTQPSCCDAILVAAAPARCANASTDVDQQAVTQQAANQTMFAENAAEADINADAGVDTETTAAAQQTSEETTGTDAHTDANAETGVQAFGIGRCAHQGRGGDGEDSDLLHDVLSTVVCPLLDTPEDASVALPLQSKGIFNVTRGVFYCVII